MKILQIALLTIGVLISARLVADEPTLSGHVEYHSADDKTTVAAFNWRKLYYDNNGTHSPAVALTEDQTKEIVKLGSEFQQIHGDKEHKDIPEDYKGAIIIFSFKPPEAKEAFTARVTEDNKADWEAIDKLRNYLDKLSAGDVENKQEKPEMATPRKPSD